MLLPLLLLALLETGLRIAGYGYPGTFVLKRSVGGKTVFVDNPRFAQRFFPPGLARSPQPFKFSADKSPDTTRIFVLGESAAMGDPEPAFGFARTLEVLLKSHYRGRNFEVINAGVTAINSHVIRDIARDLAPRQGDIWIIYMGNNEVVGPFGAGTVFGAQTPGLGFIRAGAAFKRLRVGQLADELRYRLAGNKRAQTWQGMEMFLKQRVAADDPRMTKVYDHLETNLRDIIDVATKAGAKVIVSSVASNLKDCPPFASMHQAGFAKTNEWQQLYRSAADQMRATNHARALQLLTQAAALDGRHAELQYRMGRCQLALGNTNEAHGALAFARDLDALRFRADSRINELIRNTAAARSVRFVDIAGAADRASGGIAGEELLLEHVHFNFAGNYLAAREFSRAVGELLALRADHTNALSIDACMHSLAFTKWDQLQLTEEMIRRFGETPFTHQLNHTERMIEWERRRGQLKQHWSPAAYAAAIETYRRAVSNAPHDWVLRENFAKMLEAIGELSEAERQWRAVIELMPYYAAGYYSLADVLDSQGKGAEALDYFRRALRAKPDAVEARNGIGLALANLGRKDEALNEYRKALAQKPDFVEARVNLGQLFAQQGQIGKAKEQYALALRYNSNSVAAHINLGKLLATENKQSDAIGHYREALRIQPENAVAHYNLGNALMAANDPNAESHFREAAKASPAFAEARYNLGLLLAKQNRTAEALIEFGEVARLRPEFVEARFNYGIALAKTGRAGEAMQQFEAVLQLDPQHAGARQLLDRAKGRGN